MEKSVQNARELYAQKKFSEAFDMALAVLKEDDTADKSKLFSFLGACYVNMLVRPDNEEMNKTLYDTVDNACKFASSIEDIWDIEEEILTATSQWKATNIKSLLAQLEANPILDQYQKYYPVFPQYIMMELYVQIHTRNCAIVNAFCEEQGIEKKDYAEKYGRNIPKCISDEDIKELEEAAVRRIFAQTQQKLEANANGNGEFVKNLAKRILNELLTAGCLISGTIREKDIDPDVKYRRQILHAEILHYSLAAMLYPNGQPMSLYLGDGRGKDLDKLQALYSEIKEYDPSFIAPPLPSREPVTLPQASSGGCYVATAVYGSYDCPQVWTLRRFRDDTLASTWYGRAFIRTYYAISPTLVKWFGHTQWFSKLWRGKLDKMVSDLQAQGVESTPYEDKQW